MHRIQKIQGSVLIEQPIDLFYLTGLNLSKGRLFVKQGKATLFVDGRYYAQAKVKAPCEVAHWDQIKELKEKEIGFDSAFLTYDGVLHLKEEMPHVHWIPKPHPIQELRLIKEPQEIETLKKAAHLTWQGYRHVESLLKEGVSEEELALEFEWFCRKQGASGMSFPPIIAFGENGAYPHYRAGKAKLKKGQSILIDAGAILNHYCADMTRMMHFGAVHPRIAQFEEWVARAKHKAIQAIKPGVLLGSLDQIVQDEFDRLNVKPLYIHALGHGIGLETHEFPRIRFDGVDRNVVLKPGMVFTIEPGLYEMGVGGVRLEDMVLVTETGHENLMPR